jgi:hypothetical protein
MNITLSRLSFKAIGLFGLLALMVVAPAVSRGAIIFNNLGAGQTSNGTLGNEIGNDGIPGDNLAEGDTFTPGANYTLTSVEVALSCWGSCPNNLTFDITTDSGGFPNLSNVIGTGVIPGGTLGAPSTTSLLTFTGSLSVSAGTAYWIVILPDPTGVDQAQWNLNTTGDPSTQEATAFAGGGAGDTYFELGSTPGGFEVDGTLVGGTPEPATWAMMLGGGLLLGLMRKFRA